MVTEYSDTIQDAIIAVEDDEKNIATLSTGVKLRFKPLPPFLIQTIITKFEEPKVPEVYNEDRGRMIKNRNSEEYQEALTQYNAIVGIAILDAILAFSTEIMHIPEDLERPESEGWVYDLEAVGVTIRKESERARKLFWLKTFALKEEDSDIIGKHFGLATGTGEEAIANAMDSSFPSETQ